MFSEKPKYSKDFVKKSFERKKNLSGKAGNPLEIFKNLKAFHKNLKNFLQNPLDFLKTPKDFTKNPKDSEQISRGFPAQRKEF
jgi:hypothetical protein